MPICTAVTNKHVYLIQVLVSEISDRNPGLPQNDAFYGITG